jgi:hypothetical protein
MTRWLLIASVCLATPALAEPVICEVDDLAVKDITDRSASVTFRHDTGTKVEVRIMPAPLRWDQATSLSCTGCPCVATSLTPSTNYEVGAVASLLDGSESGPMSGPIPFMTRSELDQRVNVLEQRLNKLCTDLGGCP